MCDIIGWRTGLAELRDHRRRHHPHGTPRHVVTGPMDPSTGRSRSCSPPPHVLLLVCWISVVAATVTPATAPWHK